MGALDPASAGRQSGGQRGRAFSEKSIASCPGLRNRLELGRPRPCVQVVGPLVPTALSHEGWGSVGPGLVATPSMPTTVHCPSPALKSSPSKKGRGALLAVKPLGPTAAFSASQIPSEREDAQYDLRGARSYPTLEDEGDRAVGVVHL